MPKVEKDKRKLYKCVKKVIDDVPYLCVKFKNLGTKDIREVRSEINELLTDFWVEPEAEVESDYEEKTVRFEK